MKHLVFFSLAISYLLQPLLFAQPNRPTVDSQIPSTLEVRVQRLPSSDEGTYYDNSGENKGSAENTPRGEKGSQPIEEEELTLSIIKPDAVKNNHIGDIISRFEKEGLRVAGIKMVRLSKDQAAQFYQVHKDRPFYSDLVNFMSSGPVVVIALEGKEAVSKNRKLMGATDPGKAEKGTIRADFAESVTKNAVHGSDSPETARKEILFFFRPNDIQQRF